MGGPAHKHGWLYPRREGQVIRDGEVSLTNVASILSSIEQRLGFVPPFFKPAAHHPEQLLNLWQQTEIAYLDNSLPDLFKEKLAAMLGRYCEVPYCLLCHTCSLWPLGMSGGAITELLTQEHPSEVSVTQALQRLGGRSAKVDIATIDETTEQDIFRLSAVIYFSDELATAARPALRHALVAADYRNLIAFTSYNRMCHDWMAAHPEVSYELDQRYINNYSAIAADAPRLETVLSEYGAASAGGHLARLQRVTSDRAAEAPMVGEVSERRVLDVIATLNVRATAAQEDATEKGRLAEQLQRTVAFAQELLAIVSHDLRSPLQTVLMGAQMVLQLETTNPKTTSIVGRILSSARRAERLLHDLLDFSLARAGGGIPVHLRPADLHALVRTATEDLEVEHPGHVVTVKHTGNGHGEWDADRVAQILSNLLANAVSHGKEDAPIALSTYGDADSVTIRIQNTNRGAPIPDELLPVLFDPFKRGVGRPMSQARGVGLGLYIVSELVRGHRGRASVQSTVTEGTTFIVILPRNSSCLATP